MQKSMIIQKLVNKYIILWISLIKKLLYLYIYLSLYSFFMYISLFAYWIKIFQINIFLISNFLVII